MSIPPFDYHVAFDRNIGWLTPEEQARLRASCVAIAGLGGAGGFQIQALARLGVSHFKIADPDTFEMTNINRQVGATMETIGRSKVEVSRDMILAINPEAEIDLYPSGIDENNIEDFLKDADMVVDGIDFFALDAKLLLFHKSREKKLVTLTSCPLGFGASLILFSPTGMSFEDYFDFRPEMSARDRKLTLAFGLTPSPLCMRYMNKRASEFDSGRAASVSTGLMTVGAITGAEAVKVLTGKGKVHFAPHVFQIDLFTQQVRRKFIPGGMRSPLMRLKKWIFVNFLLPRQTGEQNPSAAAGTERTESRVSSKT